MIIHITKEDETSLGINPKKVMSALVKEGWHEERYPDDKVGNNYCIQYSYTNGDIWFIVYNFKGSSEVIMAIGKLEYEYDIPFKVGTSWEVTKSGIKEIK